MDTLKSILEVFTLTPSDGLMILISLALFIAFYLCLNEFFFKDYLELYLKREEATLGATLKTADVLAELSIIQEDITSELKQSKIKAMEKKDDAIKNAKSRASETIANKENLQSKKIAEARASMSDKLETERTKLVSDVENKANQLASALLN